MKSKLIENDAAPLRKKCPYLEFFWSVFSRIRTECGEIRSMKIRTRKTPNTDTFYAVLMLEQNVENLLRSCLHRRENILFILIHDQN